MKKTRRPGPSVFANPVLVGATTVLVIVIAVFLAYNANNGLPFVPTTRLNVVVPNASRLVPGNEVREGGFRIGVVNEIKNVRLADGTAGAQLRLKIDRKAGSFPVDSTVQIRPRSALGLKYVQMTKGSSKRNLLDGDTITAGRDSATVELDTFFGIFDRPTRTAAQIDLLEFASAFAGRGLDLNTTIQALPRLFGFLTPVAANLAAPRTDLATFVNELADAARISAPVADRLSEGFTSGADVFEAFSRDPQALALTISKSPPTLDVSTASLRAQRPFLRHLAAISPLVRGTAHQLRLSLPAINVPLLTGTRVLPRTVALNDELGSALGALGSLARLPGTNIALRGLIATVATLNPTLRYVGPFVTVCNYWNYWWTYLSDHLTDRVDSGQVERVEAKTAPAQTDALGTFGAPHYANGQGATAPAIAANGDPAELHNQVYGAAIDTAGNADCETGQRGYPTRLAANAPAGYNVALDLHTPGDQGPTYTGRPRVPAGETYVRVPQAPTAVAGP